MVGVRASGAEVNQVGCPRVLIKVQIRTGRDEFPAENPLPHSRFRLRLVMTSGSYADRESPGYLLARASPLSVTHHLSGIMLIRLASSKASLF